jgi:hypothetical protein
MAHTKTLSGIKWSVIISLISTLSYLAINFLLAKIDDKSYLLGQSHDAITHDNTTKNR